MLSHLVCSRIGTGIMDAATPQETSPSDHHDRSRTFHQGVNEPITLAGSRTQEADIHSRQLHVAKGIGTSPSRVFNHDTHIPLFTHAHPSRRIPSSRGKICQCIISFIWFVVATAQASAIKCIITVAVFFHFKTELSFPRALIGHRIGIILYGAKDGRERDLYDELIVCLDFIEGRFNVDIWCS